MSASESAAHYERRQYRHPPISEALCEVRFAPEGAAWNATVPGLYYEQIRDAYPTIPAPPVAPPSIQLTGGLPMQQIVMGQIQVGAQFTTEDGSSTVSLTADNLAVAITAPYPGWEDFGPRITRAIEAYSALELPTRVNRVGLRYVNRIRIPGEPIELPEYFNNPPVTPDGFPDHLVGVFARWESTYDDDDSVRLIYTFSNVSNDERIAEFIVDLDVIQTFDQPIEPREIEPLILELKRRETAAFEAVIRDSLRELFDGD